jgi:C_GCAxxG_C_C family probable redox protein
MLGEKAVKHFLDGYNCAQSVLLTIFEHWNIRNDLVPKIATGFGGGMGRCGSVCGALVGGVMAIGVKYGTDEPSLEKRLKAYGLANELYKKFEKQHGSVLCRELIGYNLSNPKELRRAQQSKVFEKKCTIFVRTVIGNLMELDKYAK